MPVRLDIIGGGLAGSEAAWQAAEAGVSTVLHEMRPVRPTAAHHTDRLAELVCSNSLKSEQEFSAPWLLKRELRQLGSLVLRAAGIARVPGGHALTVDRDVFSAEVTRAISSHPRIEIRREEVRDLPDAGITIIASGPLTSDTLAQEIGRLTGSEPTVFLRQHQPDRRGRLRRSDHCLPRFALRQIARWYRRLSQLPVDRAQYEAFVDALLAGQLVSSHIAEDTPYFEACLPLEELARRGRDTLRFGPMKPVGLTDPRTGRRPYAVVQLRQENLRADSFNLVGFQNHLSLATKRASCA